MKLNFAKRMSYIKASEIREILKVTEQEDVISFAGGLPAPELFPIDEINEINQIVLKEAGTKALQYTTTEGYAPLREWIANRMNERLGTAFDKDNILITHGSQQGLDLSGKVFLDQGDIVLCESPTYLAAISAFKAYGCSFIEIPTDEDGMMMDVLEEILSNTPHIKLIYAIPTFQNPTGKTWSLERRRKLAELSAKYGVAVIEDNPYGELRFKGENLPTVKSLDTEGRVIYAGSFSKVLSAGMRIGWAVARKDIFEKMVICKQVSDVHTPMLTQMMAAKFFEEYSLDEHIEKSRKFYGKKCALMLDAMDRYFPDYCTYTRPEGGIFLWCTLPERFDTKKLLEVSIKNKVAFVPGFTAEVDMDAPSSEFRLNYSLPTDEQIERGIKLLADVIKNYN